MKLSQFFCNLLVCLLLALPLSATPLLTWKQQLVRQAVVKYQWLEAYNQQNDRQGLSHLNQYVIELDPNWVEERPNRVILKDNYAQLTTLLKGFNEQRQDKLRFYVVVVNDYQVDVKETVDPATLPDQITKLSQIAAPLQSKDHYQRFKAEIASIPAEIQAALQQRKYQEKAIYFYGRIKLYKLDAKPRYYYYDDLSLLEGRLKENDTAIRNKAKEGISKATPAELQIEKVVANIINAIGAVVDKKDESPQLKCDESTESMIAKTEAVKAAGMANQIKALTYLMDHPSGQQQWKSSYLIIDDPATINPDDLFSADMLPDKLELLAQGNSQYKLYVVLKEVNFLLPKAEWENFARQAASQSALAKKPNTIVVVAPYYKTLCHGVNWLGMTVNKGSGLVMPAVYSRDPALSRLMNSALAVAGNSFESRFNHAYSHIPKKHTAYYYKVLWNNDLVYHGKEEKQAVTGYEHINELVLLTDQRFDAIRAAHDAYQVVVQTNVYPGGAIQTERILDAYEKYQADVVTIMADPPRFRQVDKLNLVESNIDRETTQEFVEWYVKRRRWGFLVYFSSPEDKLFYGGRNPEKVKDALLLIDCASALASLVGADFLFDGFGAYYAFSNDLYGEAALYTVAASLPGFSSGMRRALTEGGAYALKTVQGTYVYRMKGVLATAPVPPFGIRDAFSQFTKSFLNTRSFRRASKYKTETEFIKALEEGILANEALAKRLNDYPELVDDYNTFYKQEKGTLDAFLTSPHLALLETHPKLYKQVKGLTSELRKTFMADFSNNAAVLAKFEEGRDIKLLVWENIIGSSLRKDERYLTRLSQLSSDKYVLKVENDLVKVVDNATGQEMAELSKDLARCKGGTETGKNWNEFLNLHPPIPSHKYEIDGYSFETDASGRVNKVKGQLAKTDRGRNVYEQTTRSIDVKDGLRGKDDGGHLIAQVFFGPGEQLNYVPMRDDLNRILNGDGGWRKMEIEWEAAIKSNKRVEVDITVIYESSKRPIGFEVTYTIDNQVYTKTFDN